MKAFIVAAFVAVMAGCSVFGGSAQDQYGVINDSFIESVTTLKVARDSGAIDQDTWTETIKPAIDKGSALLDQYWDQLQAGIDTQSTMAQFRAAMLILAPYLAELEGG